VHPVFLKPTVTLAEGRRRGTTRLRGLVCCRERSIDYGVLQTDWSVGQAPYLGEMRPAAAFRPVLFFSGLHVKTEYSYHAADDEN